jgi:hypothetical protein
MTHHCGTGVAGKGRRGVVLVEALFVLLLVSGLMLDLYRISAMSAQALRLQVCREEAEAILSARLLDYERSEPVASGEGFFSNGLRYRLTVVDETTSLPQTRRGRLEVIWEIDQALPADPAAANYRIFGLAMQPAP